MYKNILIGGLILVVGVLLIRGCSLEKDLASLKLVNSLSSQKFDSILNSKNQVIYQQEVALSSSKEDLKNLTDSIFSLNKKHEREIKGVIAFYSERSKIIIDSFPIPYVDSVEMKRFSDSIEEKCKEVIDYYRDSTISVPRTAKIDSTNFDISLTIRKSDVYVNTISILDTQYIRFAERKGGLFKKDVYGKRNFILPRQIIAQVLHTNPDLHIINQQSAVYVKKPKILQKILLVGAGIFIGTQIK